MKKKLKQGFTLIELMIVVAIIAILGAVVYPSYQSAVVKTKRAEGRAALMQVMQTQERYYSQNNTYVVFTKAAPNNFKWFSGEGASSSSYEISGAACTGDVIANCIQLKAEPGTANVNSSFKDAKCGNLLLTSTGVKSASGTATDCW